VEIVVVDDDFEPEERARLMQAIEDGADDFERGEYMDGFDFIAQMRARREAVDR
jgi:hypothetical protein